MNKICVKFKGVRSNSWVYINPSEMSSFFLQGSIVRYAGHYPHSIHESGANLEEVDLGYTNLREADLQFTDLRGANLRFADLQRANLRFADLQRANLQRVDLRGANFRFANLQGADLRFANLRGADLRGADLDFSTWPLHCGSFGVKVDERFIFQLYAHIARLDYCGDNDLAKEAMSNAKRFGNEFCKYNNNVKSIGE